MVDTARSSSLDHLLQTRLEDHEKRAVRRRLRPLDSGIGPRVLVDGRSVIQLCSNDYLGLAAHPAVTRAAADAALEYGAGAGSARLIVGTSAPHAALEHDIARLKQTEAALVLSSGYHANIGVLPVLTGAEDVIFSDELNHASLIDGCRLSRAAVRVYRHADAEHLARLLNEADGFRRRLIVTETVFGMDGDFAPLDDLVTLARHHDASIVVDEAHATGLFGRTGGGLVSQLGLTEAVDVQIGTLSKALGSLGGYVAGSATLVDWVVNAARTFIYTTALPPAAVAAARAAIAVLEAEPERRERVWSHAALAARAPDGDRFPARSQPVADPAGPRRRCGPAAVRLSEALAGARRARARHPAAHRARRDGPLAEWSLRWRRTRPTTWPSQPTRFAAAGRAAGHLR